MNILFLSTFLPTVEADSAGVLDAAFFLDSLSKDNEITLVSLHREDEVKHFPSIQQKCKQTFFIRDRTFESRVYYFMHTIISFFTKRPAIIQMAYSPKFKRKVKQLTSSFQYDLVVIEFIQTAYYAKFFAKKFNTIIDEQDISYLRRTRYVDTNIKNPIFKSLFYWDCRKLKKYELESLGSIDKILVRTKADMDILLKEGLKKSKEDFHLFLPWVSFEGYKEVTPCLKGTPAIMFFGAMWRPANEDAVMYFIENIWPFVLAKQPDMKFYIVGSKPTSKVLRLANNNIIVTGFVESVYEYYNKVSVVIAPLRAGSGIKGKIIQALGYGRPVVTTSVGAEGIEIGTENGLWVNDNPKEFADKLVELVNSNHLAVYQRRGDIQEKYRWDKNFSRALDFISNN